jgi:hypothetical protein
MPDRPPDLPVSGHVVLPARREIPLRVAGIGCVIDRPPITGGNMTGTSLPAPALHTARLRLRPFDDADANDLFALHSSACVLRYWDAPPWSERVRAGRFITAVMILAAADVRSSAEPMGCFQGHQKHHEPSAAGRYSTRSLNSALSELAARSDGSRPVLSTSAASRQLIRSRARR